MNMPTSNGSIAASSTSRRQRPTGTKSNTAPSGSTSPKLKCRAELSRSAAFASLTSNVRHSAPIVSRDGTPLIACVHGGRLSV